MQVRQAIVSSPCSRAIRENELTSRSEGIDDDLARELCQWSPGLTGFAFGQKQSLNFFRPDAETFALSRSVGGLDNDFDESRRVVSRVILFNRDQLRGYHNNIGLLFHVLQSEGAMILQAFPAETLPLLEVPNQAFGELGSYSNRAMADQAERIAHAVSLHGRVVVLGIKQPLSFLCRLFAQVPESKRLELSFATGLKVDDNRRFALQFFPESEPDLIKELASRQIRNIALDSGPLVTTKV